MRPASALRLGLVFLSYFAKSGLDLLPGQVSLLGSDLLEGPGLLAGPVFLAGPFYWQVKFF